MGWRQIGLFYATAGVLALWYFGYIGLAARPQRAEPAARVGLVDKEGRRFDELHLTRGSRQLVARRVDGRWAVAEPEGADVPPDLVAALAEALGAADVIEPIGDGEGQPAAFGLGEGATRIELVAPGQRSIAILLGSVNPGGTAVYAQRVGSPAIVLIGRNVAYYDDLIFEALGHHEGPAVDQAAPVGG